MKTKEVIRLDKRGAQVINSSLLNKGTAFTMEEREGLGLHGLLPSCVSTLEQQIKRTYLNYSQKKTPLAKYQCIMGLMARNELLFYQFAHRYAAEILPIIYTPTVGEAAMQYSRIYFHQRGLYLSIPLKDKLDTILSNYAQNSPSEIDVIVVTDGERILGLGDLGIGGMTIPIGKLALYTLFGGIHPARTLPVILDVGTDNPDLLDDDLYLGLRQKRVRGEEYDAFIDAFTKAIKKKYPKALLQWEDFSKGNARKILDRHRDTILSFNDDIQGTAAVTMGALFAALQVKKEALKDQKVVLYGAGSAGIGIADMIVGEMVKEGLSPEDARGRIYILNSQGLINFSTDKITDEQKPYAQPQSALKGWNVPEHISLLDVVKNAKPTILIGVSAQTGGFTEEIVTLMGKNHSRPIIFPLSNPTSRSECTPEEAFKWTEGRAILATGSPFPPVEFEGKKYKIAQCNNVYIFPGVGLSAIAVGAKKVTDAMFLEAAKTLSTFSPALKDPTASLLPDIEEVRGICQKIAIAVAKKACEEGVGECKDIEKAVDAHIWEPSYPKYAIISPY